MSSKIAIDKPGSYLLLNGDEAVARGAVEAGVKVAASYPGTPSTEILEALAEVAKHFGIYVEWSINEIVATEVAAGASMTGKRSIVSMKHVGLNETIDLLPVKDLLIYCFDETRWFKRGFRRGNDTSLHRC